MSLAKDLARIPLPSKNLESRALNRLGVQSARTLAARIGHRARTAKYTTNPWVRALRREGACIIPNFLPLEFFAALREEALAIMEQSEAHALRVQGSTTVRQFAFLKEPDERTVALREYLRQPELRELFEGAEGRPFHPNEGVRYLEEVSYSDSAEHDPESDLHIDIFFSNHKAWLYLDDVGIEQGPLVFVPGSHRIDLPRMRAQYAECITTNERSRRIRPEELEARGLEEQVISVKANTLVMADTFGYHRRLPGKPGEKRRAIQIGMRLNPFMPPSWEALLRNTFGGAGQ